MLLEAYKRLKNTTNKGFSLIEMSVVLASVTAVIAMVTGGAFMISNSQNKNILSNIEQYRTAIEKFEKKYKGLPGDIVDTADLVGVPSGGNGNGVIDNEQEAVLFWNHLSSASLVQGNYNGDFNSRFDLGVGVPGSDIQGGGYRVRLADTINIGDVSEQGIVIEFTGYNNNSNRLGILTPESARSLDRKADDGLPNSGIVLAEGENCVDNDGNYNVSEDAATCRVLFIVRGSLEVDDEEVLADGVNGCNSIGDTREINDVNESCPLGYSGKVLQSCRLDDDGEGFWEITDRFCQEVTCSHGGKFGDTRRLACINDMVGTGVVERCREGGLWVIEENNCEVREDVPCSEEGTLRKSHACSLGERGFILQRCNNSKWEVERDTCEPIECGGDQIGELTDSGANCPTGYLNTGDTFEVCTIAGRNEITGIGSTCVPDYTGNCNAATANNRNIGCATGETGTHILTCVDAPAPDNDYWTTLIDTCTPITCDGGEAVGSYRILEGVECPQGRNGTVMEYCTINADNEGEWVVSEANCVTGVCDATDDLVGNAFWPTSVAGVVNSANCNVGYEVSGNARRRCNADGTWADTAIKSCDRILCEEETLTNSTGTKDDDATYRESFAGQSDVIGECEHPDYEGRPRANCSIMGNWENERLMCREVCRLPNEQKEKGVKITYESNTANDPHGNGYVFVGTEDIEGACQSGYYGSPKGICLTGDKIKLDSGSCKRACTFSQKVGKATYPSNPKDPIYGGKNYVLEGETVVGKCANGYNGNPIGKCNDKGKIYTESGSCVLNKPTHCPVLETNNARYAKTKINTKNVSGTCINGYLGSPTRDCDKDGNWKAEKNSCTPPPTHCQAKEINNATYPKTEVGNNNVSGVCKNGYSGSPKMDCSAAGNWHNERNPCVEDFDEEEIKIEDMTMWFDAQDNDTVFKSSSCSGAKAKPGSDNIGCWRDKSGNNYHAKQSSSSRRPAYTSYASGRNGYPVVRFNQDILYYPYKAETKGFSMFVVHKENKFKYTDGYMTILGSNGEGEEESVWMTFDASPKKFRLYRGFDKKEVNFSYTYKANKYNISHASYNLGAVNYTRNGVNEGSASDITDKKDKNKRTQWGPGGIGGWQETSSKFTEHYYGDVAEIVLYDTKLNTTKRKIVEKYLSDKWNIK